MKPLPLISAVGVTFLALLLATPAHSQHPYFTANLGASLADDVDLHHYVTPTPGAKFELDPGVRLSVAGGFNFNEFIGAELESGFIVNTIKNVPDNCNCDSSLSHVPLMANIVLRYDRPNFKLVPYIGAGAGGDVSVLTLNHVAGLDGTDSTVVFAWQAFAGVRFKLNEQMSIGAGYKYYSAEGASWDVEHSSGDVEIGTARVHSVGVDFSMKF